MVSVLLVLALAVAAVVAARRWMAFTGPVTPRDQVEAFDRARAVTQRWAEDPDSMPGPLKEHLIRQRQPDDE